MKDILRLGIILAVICVVAAGLLAATNGITAPIITQQALEAETAAKQAVLPQGEEFIDMDANTLNDLLKTADNENARNVVQVNMAYDTNNQFVGMALKTEVSGFGGDIIMLIGIDAQGSVTTYQVLSHSETAGLGDNMNKDFFKDQFSGKSTSEDLTVVKRSPAGDAEVQAITGATISSKAVTLAVNSAMNAYNIIIEQQEGGVKQ
jgi:electron transport complex protein RnfG